MKFKYSKTSFLNDFLGCKINQFALQFALKTSSFLFMDHKDILTVRVVAGNRNPDGWEVHLDGVFQDSITFVCQQEIGQGVIGQKMSLDF